MLPKHLARTKGSQPRGDRTARSVRLLCVTCEPEQGTRFSDDHHKHKEMLRSLQQTNRNLGAA